MKDDFKRFLSGARNILFNQEPLTLNYCSSTGALEFDSTYEDKLLNEKFDVHVKVPQCKACFDFDMDNGNMCIYFEPLEAPTNLKRVIVTKI
jgi:hypothetical protein